jgi:cell wall-associated NlpC family hydrolase
VPDAPPPSPSDPAAAPTPAPSPAPRGRDFASLYRATIAPLRRYLTRLLGNTAEAQDIAHDAYLRLYPTASADPARYDQPEAVLYTTARRLAMDEIEVARNQAQAQRNEQAALNAKVQGEVAELVRREQEAIRAAAAVAAAARRSSNVGSSSRGSSQVSVNVPPANGSVANAAIRAGLIKVGSPYVWAAGGPSAFDCSGFTQWAFGQAGIRLPHYSGAQYAMTTRISASQLQPGDLVFWGGSGSAHVAIYMGNDQLVHAFGSGGVDVTALDGWWMPPSGYGRLNL